MKKLKAILSIALMAILIFSTLGFSVTRHYCMGMVVEESFYSVADDCGMNFDDHCNDGWNHIKKNCCEDEKLSISGINVLSFGKEKAIPKFYFPASFKTVTVLPEYLHSPVISRFQADHSPPDRFFNGRAILIQVQRFLI